MEATQFQLVGFHNKSDDLSQSTSSHSVIADNIRQATSAKYIYSGTCLIRHPLGNVNSAGLAGCWIIGVSLYGKINCWCQRNLTGLGECWFIV